MVSACAKETNEEPLRRNEVMVEDAMGGDGCKSIKMEARMHVWFLSKKGL